MDDDTLSNISGMNDKYLIDALTKENSLLKRRVAELEKTLSQYDIEDIDQVTDVEFICIEEIKKLKETSQSRNLMDVEVKNLDLLHKNLRQVLDGKSSKKKPKEKDNSTVAELLSIVNNDKE